MSKRHVLVVCLLIAGLLLSVSPARAIFGIGDIVFDPSNMEEAVLQLVQLEQQYTQLVQTYQTVRSQYDQMLRMAQIVPVSMSARYRAITTPWQTSSASNRYGTTGAWITGINTGSSVDSGYNVATQTLQDYGAALANIPSDQVGRIKTSYATVELTDGANRLGMQTVGKLRANAPQVENAIRGLEDDSLSSAPDMNTEIAVLNKINAANLIAVRTGQDANKILVSLAEQQIIDAKRKRDAEGQAIDDHIRFMSEGRSAISDQSNGASAAMLAWKMP